jgi:hypothetical protein
MNRDYTVDFENAMTLYREREVALIRDAGKSVLRPFEVDNYENKEFEQISLNHFY